MSYVMNTLFQTQVRHHHHHKFCYSLFCLADVFLRRSTNARTEALAKAKKNWRLVSKDALVQDHNDPWADLRERTSEKALKYEYDAKTGAWTTVEWVVKTDLSQAFAKGAMRECFRMKKVLLLSYILITEGHFFTVVWHLCLQAK
jgi:hypothetical protein